MTSEQLDRIVQLLESINLRLGKIELKLDKPVSPTSSIDLLTKIPKSHFRTYDAIQNLGEATCTEVAEITGRSHNLESRYLVKLHDLGVLGKKRIPVSDPSKRGTEVKYFVEEVS